LVKVGIETFEESYLIDALTLQMLSLCRFGSVAARSHPVAAAVMLMADNKRIN
jgi:hypothetical protein